jgi:hypothetical protein
MKNNGQIVIPGGNLLEISFCRDRCLYLTAIYRSILPNKILMTFFFFINKYLFIMNSNSKHIICEDVNIDIIT